MTALAPPSPASAPAAPAASIAVAPAKNAETPPKDSRAMATAEPAPVTKSAVKPAAPPASIAANATPASLQAITAPAEYPGIPRLLGSALGRNIEADRTQLLGSARWTIVNGKWQQHLTALLAAIGNAAMEGPSLQQSANLQSITSTPIALLAFEQARFIRAIGADSLGRFSKELINQDFLAWLMERPAILSAFNRTIQPRDKGSKALLQWRTIWLDDAASRETLSSLAIACALVFDETVGISKDVYRISRVESSESGSAPPPTAYHPTEVSALDRFRFYRDSAKSGSLKVSPQELAPWELVWVVDAPVPESELIWAQKHVNYPRHEWGRAYGHIRYRMDRATQGVNPYKAYTLEEIEKEGGICGDQAYFSAITAKANGIPAMSIGGEGDRGAHAWFGYEQARNDWNLSTGRYNDNYAAGTTRNPQTGETLKEHELRQWTDPARRGPSYEDSEKLLALAKLLKEAQRPEQASLAVDLALRMSNKNYHAWKAHLEDMAASSDVASDIWLRESARARTTFKEFPDLIEDLQKREAAYVAAHGDSNAARQLVHTQTARLGRKDGERTDLILDSVAREAELAAKSGDKESVGRIYRDALKEKGGEMVAFRQISDRYYHWGKDAGQGPEVVRSIVSAFERKHEEPRNDVFAMGAYRGMLDALVGMAKEQSLDALQHQLERREEKLEDEQKKLGKLQSKNAAR